MNSSVSRLLKHFDLLTIRQKGSMRRWQSVLSSEDSLRLQRRFHLHRHLQLTHLRHSIRVFLQEDSQVHRSSISRAHPLPYPILDTLSPQTSQHSQLRSRHSVEIRVTLLQHSVQRMDSPSQVSRSLSVSPQHRQQGHFRQLTGSYSTIKSPSHLWARHDHSPIIIRQEYFRSLQEQTEKSSLSQEASSHG